MVQIVRRAGRWSLYLLSSFAMRLLIALVALLSGLSVPQAVAAAGRVNSSVVATETVSLAEAAQPCVVRRALLHPRAVDPVARVVPVLAVIGIAPAPSRHFGDCARE